MQLEFEHSSTRIHFTSRRRIVLGTRPLSRYKLLIRDIEQPNEQQILAIGKYEVSSRASTNNTRRANQLQAEIGIQPEAQMASENNYKWLKESSKSDWLKWNKRVKMTRMEVTQWGKRLIRESSKGSAMTSSKITKTIVIRDEMITVKVG